MTNELLVKKHYLKEMAPLTKTYVEGGCSPEVLKIKEWLMLWELNENDVSEVLTLNDVFDRNTTLLTKQVQKFLDLEPTGKVDGKTWQALVMPLRKAFDLQFLHQNLRQRMKYFASRHLQYRAAELEEDNIGPWVRSYMTGGYDGQYAYWCQAFASTILDQTFSSIGEYFTEYYINTDACEFLRRDARKRGLLVNHQELAQKKYVPQDGDIVLYLMGDKDEAHHTEIVYEVLDQKTGQMRTIGGNTNFSGSRNGVGVFLVDRNFLGSNVEIVKLVDEETIQKHKSYPVNARKLMRAYPGHIIGYRENHVIFSDGTQLLFDDGKEKTTLQLLEEPDINDQFFYIYPRGESAPPKPFDDPGRITNQEFFKKMYGSTQTEVEKNLTEIVWCPNLCGEKIKVTTINNVSEKLGAVSNELDQHPELKPYLNNIGGTFKWREVSGTKRLSLHSFGIAIDINVEESNYWQWDAKTTDETARLTYKNRIPQKVVDVFEKYGFIWGGKWYHYDTMHFEYRPELLPSSEITLKSQIMTRKKRVR